jgi:predicted acylesterase/phospholipase RssA
MKRKPPGAPIALRWMVTAVSIFMIRGPAVARPKVGLVLSGGGARGFAHIGVLKMLDSLDVPVDCIAGTSMGGIVGALYSIGYSGRDLEALANRNDWMELFTDRPPRSLLPYLLKKETGRYQLEFSLKGFKPVTPGGLIYGQKISLLFSSLTFPYERVTDFDNFPVAFRCVASDLVRGERVVLKSGSLSKAMRATMAIPTVFSPVEWGDSLLVDGGLLDNLPVDVVKEMGADVVIAVDVGYPLRNRSEIQSALVVLEQSMAMLGIERRRENLPLIDVLIQPDLGGFSLADFSSDKIRKIIHCGDRAARKSVDALVGLRERFGFRHLRDSTAALPFEPLRRIEDIEITGYTTTPFELILSRIGLKSGDPFNPVQIRNRLAEIKAAGSFEDIRMETIVLSDQRIRLQIRVQERHHPLISGILINGNHFLPAGFVTRLLGLTVGDSLDSEILNRRIMEMYGYGYFESIQYDIKPVDEDRVDFTLRVKELPLKKLRLGIRYDDLHKLVGLVGLQQTNVLIPGLRLENDLQFAGLIRWKTKAYYPSINLAMPAYPFAEVNAQDVPTHVFNGDGEQIVQYNFRSADAELGLGFILSRSFNLEIGYRAEMVRIRPNIADPDPFLFSNIHDNLRQIHATLNIDGLDDVFIPKRGFLFDGEYEQAFSRLHSGVAYSRFYASANAYATFHRRHTLRFYGFGCNSSARTPIYKFYNRGKPESFIGMQYDQLIGSRMGILRLEYRYQHKKDIFLKLMANAALGFGHVFPAFEHHKNCLWGAGIGVTLLSPVGPIDIAYGRGSQGVSRQHGAQNVLYFSMGYQF